MLINRIKRVAKRIFFPQTMEKDNINKVKLYVANYNEQSFAKGELTQQKQFEPYITRMYHILEKGLAFENFRAGFGKANVDELITAMTNYSKIFGTDAIFYSTAIDVLNRYVEKNKEYGVQDLELEEKIRQLGGKRNNLGGTVEVTPINKKTLQDMDYKQFILSRHSIRQFSRQPVDVNIIVDAVKLAQHTPSACNRQGWHTRIISNKDMVLKVLSNQNGNRGFTEEIDKVLIITANLRCFNRDREIFQPYIDGGMYAMSILNSLHYYGLASIPLSASLTNEQEKNLRNLLNINNEEVLILIVGVGNYLEKCVTTRSERYLAEIDII